MKKIIILLSLTLTLNPFTVFASVNAPVFTNTTVVDTADQEISPISDIIGWRYKTVNGKIYKRQFNYSKDKWIGEWEAC